MDNSTVQQPGSHQLPQGCLVCKVTVPRVLTMGSMVSQLQNCLTAALHASSSCGLDSAGVTLTVLM